MKRSTILLAVAAAVLVLTAAAPIASARGGSGGGGFLAAGLKGANEVPPVSTGDPDGAGYAVVRLVRSERTVCVEDAAFGGIDAPILFHIHRGAAGTNGPVVVDFTGLLQTGNVGCVPVLDRRLLNDLRAHPDQYYINVHTAPFPGGAIRGQLVVVLP